ncbi:uncharacterized protein K452DRAFT_362792 [Aplosporella prunicola CBS 121167]|uniref:NACHT domain-containing protein n=1 Tax=Aplosporella prunicola CBS 121167 TaxID=1176127 RepID=A0A6A6AWQ0_9PEZI|nr:uncharacterized protein K452DRAFT_362792 [Aplosporella prunicola CBS 121167]KAF2136036.1 hypothetical protein K452DRAFT_362792 [Aplosporella prunicola CBS 121167]
MTPENKIEHDTEKRKEQMRQLVQNGLQKIKKEANMKQGIESGIQVAMVFKEVVDKAVQASSEAALAWVGILTNPLTEANSNQQGIEYVVRRMNWYWELSRLLLDTNIKPDQQGLRGVLEEKVTQLYAQLLLFQMKSVCYYYRRRFRVFVRDLVKLDNWDGKLDNIKDAEAAVRQDSSQYNTQVILDHLSDILKIGESQISAIQQQTKQQEAMHETDEDKKCRKDLRVTDPRDDKKRIEGLKGGLLKDSYKWILENSQFKKWRNEDDPQSRLLWVKADPGKGKTMLLCGIIDELQEPNIPNLLAYFFCQATDSRINSATAVLRGLLYLLVEQQRSLISHVRKKYDRAGQALFNDTNAWVALSEIFTNILNDANLEKTCLIIDALDECTTGLDELLDFIAQKSLVSPHVKWIVSSRNWSTIEERLDQADHKVRLSLELNEESVSKAVSTFIEHKVSRLEQQKKYNETIRDAVLKHLTSNANNTFLWVALVCQRLEKVDFQVKEELKAFPPGLDSLYERMMLQIHESQAPDVCKRILASVAIVYRPITTKELATLVEKLEDMADDHESMERIISLCGSFLTVKEGVVYFVHQSAKDFLFSNASDEVFPSGEKDVHYSIFSRSLNTMSKALRRDMYDLKELGYPAEQIRQPNPDPLAASRYACFY